MPSLHSLLKLNWGRLADRLLLALLVVTAFLLGCYEMADSDVWWHLAGGRWILEHRQVPGLDPFTFGSADRLWVDVHWSFEVLLAGAYRLGGVAGLVLTAATGGALAVLAAVTARRSGWPAAVSVLCWLPALVLVSWRFDPRPEIFSLLYLSLFLAVLWRVERRPALVWLLPGLEVLWANTQGLFVLGPVVVALFVATRGARLLWDRRRGRLAWGPEARRWWTHVGSAALAVGAAVFVNPYGLDGVRFPFDLYPKVAREGNPYKEYIDELNSPRVLVAKSDGKFLADGYIRCLYLLLLAVPASFVLPAAWRAWRAAPPPHPRPLSPKGARGDSRPPHPRPLSPKGRGEKEKAPPRVGAWVGAAAAVGGLLVWSTIALPRRGLPEAVRWGGDQAALLLGLGTVATAAALGRRSRQAALVAGAGGLALAGWMTWLRDYLTALDAPEPSLVPPALLGLAVAGLLVWQGADLFRLLLAGAFGYLALRAQQNDSRFGLVAGLVLSWNLGEWAAELSACLPPTRRIAVAAWTARLGLAGLLGLWIAAIVTDRHGRWTGEPRHFSLQEQPFEHAHEAIRFAGGPGLPERALLYDLGQPSLYVFYHGPARKPFLDGRLEMPALETFRTYVRIEGWLNEQDPRWAAALDDLGKPLVLLTHRRFAAGEAALLAHPGWRCIYWDAVASVFVPQGGADEGDYPTIDFAARHFGNPTTPSVPDRPGAALHELSSLVQLDAALRQRPEATWTWRVPSQMRALDRAGLALQESPERRPEVWTLLGNCHRNLALNAGVPPPDAADEWDPAAGMPWAQATYCFRRALEVDPAHVPALRSLYDAYRARGMADAVLDAGERLIALGEASAEQTREVEKKLWQMLGPLPRSVGKADLPAAVAALLHGGRVEAAVQMVEDAQRRGSLTWTWPLARRMAPAYLHLGRPADARRAWEQAAAPPSEAVRRCRLAETYWVERDLAQAAAQYRAALTADPPHKPGAPATGHKPEAPAKELAEAWWGLALLEAQRGDAAAARQACREALRLSLPPRLRADLQGLATLLDRCLP
jgi:tetratricopeptide (TPR) repeat protein